MAAGFEASRHREVESFADAIGIADRECGYWKIQRSTDGEGRVLDQYFGRFAFPQRRQTVFVVERAQRLPAFVCVRTGWKRRSAIDQGQLGGNRSRRCG